MIVNVDGEIILSIPKFRDASQSSFDVSYDWIFSYRCMLGGSDFEIG